MNICAAQDEPINANFDIRKVRKHDLLLMSRDKLDGEKDLKTSLTKALMIKLLQRSDVFLAFVVKDRSPLLCEVDPSKAEIFEDCDHFNIYQLESLGPTLREYVTIFGSQFLPCADLLLKPVYQAQSTSCKFSLDQQFSK